jgi:hypothetical protein
MFRGQEKSFSLQETTSPRHGEMVANKVRMEDHVMVDEYDIGAVGVPDRQILDPGLPDTLVVVPHLAPSGPAMAQNLLNHPLGLGTGAVVGDYHLIRYPGLCED